MSVHPTELSWVQIPHHSCSVHCQPLGACQGTAQNCPGFTPLPSQLHCTLSTTQPLGTCQGTPQNCPGFKSPITAALYTVNHWGLVRAPHRTVLIVLFGFKSPLPPQLQGTLSTTWGVSAHPTELSWVQFPPRTCRVHCQPLGACQPIPQNCPGRHLNTTDQDLFLPSLSVSDLLSRA